MMLAARFAAVILIVVCCARADARKERLADLPTLEGEAARPVKADWLVIPSERASGVYRTENPNEIVMTNGLISRTWRIKPNAACVAFDNLMTGASILRGVKPEAILELDSRKYDVGGLLGQVDYAYLLPEWLDAMTSDPAAFQFDGLEVGQPAERVAWNQKRYSAPSVWPPKGVALTLHFSAPKDTFKKLKVAVHYEMYDGIPVISKWFTIENGGKEPVRLNTFISEVLAAVEPESVVDDRERWDYPNLHIESDYTFKGMDPATGSRTTCWVADPQHTTQVNYNLQTPNLLESRPPIGPDALIEPGKTFESFHTFELVFDSTERERKGLAQRRMYRVIAPWATENPILMHVSQATPEAVRLAVDQCAEVGFEMIIMTFGSGLDMENVDPAYLAEMKAMADYAHGKGIELGGYSLLASRSVSPEVDVINPETGQPGGAVFGNSPCIGSKWGIEYLRKLETFFAETGFDLLEHDGSYPGDVCASTTHPGHGGLDDSQWTQWRQITDFYKGCRARGVYLNVPDWYFLNGSNKTGMGYREVNWSLPRERQIILGRQNIFDGTWGKTPSMGWMFVPLVQYHGGGKAATLEPLCEHLDAYGAHLAQNFGSGVQACYRGPRLFDTEETKAVVKKWVDFYRTHRAILDSDIIHVRRADGRDIDCMMHVNPALEEKGLAMVFNPLDQPVEKDLELPLYYTGLTDTARIREQEGASKEYALDRAYAVRVPVAIPARGVTWLVIE